MQDRDDVGRKAMRSARELAHLATSVAAEAANLTRALEPFGAASASVAASHASIRAAQSAFSIDAVALSSAGRPDVASLHEVFLQAESCLDAADAALDAAREALRAATMGLTPSEADGPVDS